MENGKKPRIAAKKIFGHLSMVMRHRHYVRKACFAMGMPLRGIKHDLSKYSFAEFWPSVRYYDGKRSPVLNEREHNGGFSLIWVHHRCHNAHHWEHWLSSPSDGEKTFMLRAAKMPYGAVIESICDAIGAGKAYEKKNWRPSHEAEYFSRNIGHRVYHPETKALVEELVAILSSSRTEGEFYRWYRSAKKGLKEKYESGGFAADAAKAEKNENLISALARECDPCKEERGATKPGKD